jgi:hypothetical protein
VDILNVFSSRPQYFPLPFNQRITYSYLSHLEFETFQSIHRRYMYIKSIGVRMSLFSGCCFGSELKQLKFTLIDGACAIRIRESTVVVLTFR